MTKTALVTGAGSGFGASLIPALRAAGWNAWAGVQDRSLLAERAPALRLDVTDQADTDAAVAALRAATPSLELLVCNAAVFPACGAAGLANTDPEAAIHAFSVNAAGALRITKACLPLLLAARDPVVVLVSSEAGSIAACSRKGWYSYSMSKAALNMMARTLANEFEGRVHVLALHPGWMRTPMGLRSGDAPLDPALVAQQLIELVAPSRRSASGSFVDHEGKPLPW